jgi:hypothetical protein
MNKTLTIGAMIAIIAAVGAVATTLTPMGFVQQAEAASCQNFFDADGNLQKVNCSSDNSRVRADAVNFNSHTKQ